MNDDHARRDLQNSPLTRGLSTEEISGLAARMSRLERPEGSVLFEEGSTGDRLIFLLEGRVDVLKNGPDGEAHKLAELKAPTVFGEIAFLGGGQRNADVRAATSVTLLELDRAAFEDLLAEGSPAAGRVLWNLARVLSTRLDRMDDELVRLQEGSTAEAEISTLRRRLLTDWDF